MQHVRTLLKQRGTLARQQLRFVAATEQPAMQPQHLPLSAAHFPARVEVQNSHEPSLALAYLRNV